MTGQNKKQKGKKKASVDKLKEVKVGIEKLRKMKKRSIKRIQIKFKTLGNKGKRMKNEITYI